MADASPRLVAYPSPSEYLKAVLPFDNWHLNVCLGHTVVLLREPGDENAGLWLTIWTGDQLDLLLTRTIPMICLNSPSDASRLSPSWLEPRMALLADEFHRLTTAGLTSPLTSVIGPKSFVDAFAVRWEILTGSRPHPDPVMDIRLSHLPRSRVPPSTLSPPLLPPGHSIHPVSSHESAEGLAKLLQAFSTHGNRTMDADAALQSATLAIKLQEVLAYTVTTESGPELAGYVRTGRFTLHNGTVRNVFTLPKYRRAGIGEHLTRAAVRHMLSHPNPFKDELERLTTEKVAVEDITIFAEISNPSAQNIYRRVGFGFNEGEWEENGEKSWEHCVELEY